MNKTTAIKLIDQGESSRRRHLLYVAEADGRKWATNSYWLAPAEWFSVVIGDDPKVGTWNVKADGWQWEDGPEVARLFPSTEHPIIEPVAMRGRPVILDRGELPDLALFADADGAETALDRRYVDMFRQEATGPAGSELLFRQENALKPAYVYRRTTYTSVSMAKTEGWSLTGVLMPVRIS